MRVDVKTGLLVGVNQVLSPYFDERPTGVRPDLIVLHGISLPPGEFGGPWVARLFTGNLPADAHPEFRERAGLRVSAHLFVRRGGEVVQFVSFNDRAWHAGRSSWQGREACNDYSIGIECEGTDEVPYSEAQYACLRKLLPMLLAAYPAITRERIVGHSDVAPGRKTDPGPSFDWGQIYLPTTSAS
ncbi:MAG TPA: 1,6-anhydro-N-acetylmuramyl-L-alanine amidase AmpD [Steroidobacteraceae bacterium]|nr:1,6-anhydro-N-acetylmuramyl-L-alanine amidase AmpD [Steroidobacteraceae bacterium]